MQKFTLLPSVQGGVFNNQNKMIDLDIPENHMCDLSQSFVQLECMVDPPADLAGVVANMCVRNKDYNNLTPMNVDLIKNCNLVSATKGKLEDIRRVNVLSHNLNELSKSTVNKLSTIDSLYQIHSNDSNMLLSPFVELHKVGSVAATYQHAHLRIPLSQLVQLGAVSNFDTSKFGRTRLHLELDDVSKLEVYQQLMLDIDGYSTTTTPVAANNITTGSTVVITEPYDSLELSPWYVGQKVVLSGTTPPATEVADISNAIITSIAYAEDTGIVSLTTSYTFMPITPTGDYTSITVREFTSTNVGTLTILGAKLGLCTVDSMKKVESPNELEYLTFTTEEYSVGNQAFMNKIFEIEPECVNTFLMFNNGSILSNLNSIFSYRLRVDNVDLFDRDVNLRYSSGTNATTNDPAHYELLNKTFANAGLSLKSLVCNNINRVSVSPDTKFEVGFNNILMICSPVPMTTMTKKYQVNLEASAAPIGNVILFKQVVRSVRL